MSKALRNYNDPKVVPLELRHPWRSSAYAKCLPGYGARDPVGCGATFMTRLDWQLHVCDVRATLSASMHGRSDDRVVHLQGE